MHILLKGLPEWNVLQGPVCQVTIFGKCSCGYKLFSLLYVKLKASDYVIICSLVSSIKLTTIPYIRLLLSDLIWHWLRKSPLPEWTICNFLINDVHMAVGIIVLLGLCCYTQASPLIEAGHPTKMPSLWTALYSYSVFRHCYERNVSPVSPVAITFGNPIMVCICSQGPQDLTTTDLSPWPL